jgi:hypothetical protein
MSSRDLSQGDERILSSVFDPENSPDTPAAKIDPSLPEDPHITDASLLSQLRNKELQAVRSVEQYSLEISSKPNFSNAGSSGSSNNNDTQSSEDQEKKNQVYIKAQSILSQLINEYPLYASAYNNRAQLHRWYYGHHLISIEALRGDNEETITALDAIFKDLDEAVRLASPTGTNAVVSPGQAKLLGQAWTQRGAVLWGLAKTLEKESGTPIERRFGSSVPEWRTWDAMRLEEEGSRSFYMAGLYGSEVGRAMAVKTNPYARLCAGIVKEAMASEYSFYM